MTDPNAYQIGGNHYRSKIQHWDVMAKLRANYFIGCTTKYIIRFEDKNGLEDIAKAIHFLNKADSVKMPGVASWRLWLHRNMIDDWLASSIAHSHFYEDIVITVNCTLIGDYQYALGAANELLYSYSAATNPTHRYTYQ